MGARMQPAAWVHRARSCCQNMLIKVAGPHHWMPQRPSPASSKSRSPHWHSGHRLETSTYWVVSGIGFPVKDAARCQGGAV